jgi:tripartite-type tricarboxylate transporter receptor subunit TctC
MDTLVRLYGEKLSQNLGQPVVIDNRPGGAGVVAGETIAKGASDGYTLAVATSAVMAIRPYALQATAVRPAHRLLADLALREIAIRARRPAFPAGSLGCGFHHIRKGAAGTT